MMINASLTHEEIAIRIRDDLDFLAAVLIPDVAESPFPDFYKMVWALMLTELHKHGPKDIFRFALGLPRGHAKTTFIKLLVCYLLLHDYSLNFIQVVCATEPLAENFLADVHQMMQAPTITQVYGRWEQSLTRDTMKHKKAKWLGRSIILVAIGAGTSTRGLNLDNRRPNLIICDDAQTKENDESDTDRTKLLLWLIGTLFKSLTKTEKKAIFYIGNQYSEECILNTFAKMKQWTSLITGAILADGSALWPAIQTVEEALEEYEHDASVGLGHVWFAEVQNDPIGSSAGLLDIGETVPPPPIEDYTDLDIYPIRFITIDPAGQNASSDDNVVAVHCLQEQNQAGTITLKHGKWSPGQLIDQAIALALEWGVGIIFVESVAYQKSLAYWIETKLRERSLAIKVIPLGTGTASKFRRIKAWVKQWVTGQWHVHEHKAYNKLLFQLYKYKTNKKDNVDDILDVCAQAILAINKHGVDIINSQRVAPDKESRPPAPVLQSRSRLSRLTTSMRLQ